MAKKTSTQAKNKGHVVLGDIMPEPSEHEPVASRPGTDDEVTANDEDKTGMDEALGGGSQRGRTRHPGTRSVTEGVTGGTGTETGGTRNYRQGTGATGGDIGNRPE
jgi:hypothetical protein